MVYELVPSLIMWIIDCCAAAGSAVVMAVAATTIAVITAMMYILVIVIPNSHVYNGFKRTVRKFGICLDKKLKVDYFSLLAPTMVNSLLQLRQMKFPNGRLLASLKISCRFVQVSQSSHAWYLFLGVRS